MTWYLIQTKPRQELIAEKNLKNQGYECYLPLLKVEKIQTTSLEIVQVPLFSRYLFIQLESGFESKSWAPIRSTKGVSNLVKFGQEPAKVHDELIGLIKSRESMSSKVVPLFMPGQILQIKDGPFAGLEAIYKDMSSERRVVVLLELMSKPVKLMLELNSVKQVS